MYGIYVNEPSHCTRYATAIAQGVKTLETRNRNTLRSLVGKRVAIIRTIRNRAPEIVGYADITGSFYCKTASAFRSLYAQHLVPEGSTYDCPATRGKWCYQISNATACTPTPVPTTRINHGRSYCEL